MIQFYLIWLLNLGALAYLAFLVYRSNSWPLKKFFIPGITAKLAAGIGVGLLYQIYYQGQGDTFLFYEDATILCNYFYSDPSGFLGFLVGGENFPQGLVYSNQPRALIFAELLAGLKIITFGNYWILSLYLSFFSFLGLWLLSNQLVRSFNISTWVPALAFLFTPSVVFWSSGILKESLALGIAGLLMADFLNYLRTNKLSTARAIMGLVLFILLLGLKYYTAALLIALVATFLITHILIKGSVVVAQSPAKQAKFWLLIFVVLMFMASSLHPNLYPQQFLDVLVNNHYLTLKNSAQDSIMGYYQLQPTLGSVLLNFPLAVFYCLYRPVVFEAANFFQGIAAFENLLLLIVTIAALFKLKRAFVSGQILWVMGGLVYIILGSGLIALSTPNPGTLARYKVMFVPFLVFLIMIDNPIINQVYKRWKERNSAKEPPLIDEEPG